MEAKFNTDLSKLEGEPYLTTEWGNYSYNGKSYLKLKLIYRWKGYQVMAHQAGYSKPDEFGDIEVEQDTDNPKVFNVVSVGVAEPFRRKGYGTNLYRKAMELVKAKGFEGIRSDRGGRTQDADKLWGSFDKTGDSGHDYLK